MTPYQSLTDHIIKLEEEAKRLKKIWKRTHPNDEKIEGWDDDSVD